MEKKFRTLAIASVYKLKHGRKFVVAKRLPAEAIKSDAGMNVLSESRL